MLPKFPKCSLKGSLCSSIIFENGAVAATVTNITFTKKILCFHINKRAPKTSLNYFAKSKIGQKMSTKNFHMSLNKNDVLIMGQKVRLGAARLLRFDLFALGRLWR